MLLSRCVLFMVVCLALVSAKASGQTLQADERDTDALAHLEGDALEVARWVIHTQRAGWERGDAATYLLAWSEQCTLTVGRLETPGPYDMVYNYDRLLGSRLMRLRPGMTQALLAYDEVEVEFTDEGAVFCALIHTRSPDGEFGEVGRDRIVLGRDGRIIDERYWLVGRRVSGEDERVDEGWWAERDREISSIVATDHPADVSYRYFEAWRMNEAHALLIDFTERVDAEAADWSARGFCAAIIGDYEDALASLELSYELDPDAWRPLFAEKMPIYHGSPADVFEAYREAFNGRDWEALVECVSPMMLARDFPVIRQMVGRLARGGADREQIDALLDLSARVEVTPYYVLLAELMVEHGMPGARIIGIGEIETTSGEGHIRRQAEAIVTIESGGARTEHTLLFVRHHGGWYLRMIYPE